MGNTKSTNSIIDLNDEKIDEISRKTKYQKDEVLKLYAEFMVISVKELKSSSFFYLIRLYYFREIVLPADLIKNYSQKYIKNCFRSVMQQNFVISVF